MSRYTDDRLLFLQRCAHGLRWLAVALVVAWGAFFAVVFHSCND